MLINKLSGVVLREQGSETAAVPLLCVHSFLDCLPCTLPKAVMKFTSKPVSHSMRHTQLQSQAQRGAR